MFKYVFGMYILGLVANLLIAFATMWGWNFGVSHQFNLPQATYLQCYSVSYIFNFLMMGIAILIGNGITYNLSEDDIKEFYKNMIGATLIEIPFSFVSVGVYLLILKILA